MTPPTPAAVAGRSTVNALLTALAVFKPGVLGFLHNVKNRYTLDSNVLNQSLYHELITTHEITLELNVEPATFALDVEKEWVRLQKCAKSALSIHREFESVEGITLHADGALSINTPTATSRIQTHKTQPGKLDFYELLGFQPEPVLADNAFTELTNAWVESLRSGLKAEYADVFDKLRPHSRLPSFAAFRNTKVRGLGTRVTNLPRLYYNSAYQFSLDVVKTPTTFHDFAAFEERWLAIVDSHLNRDILLPALKETRQRSARFAPALHKVLNQGSTAHYHFDAKQQLVPVESAESFAQGFSSEKLSQKYYINKKSQLIVNISQGQSGTLKIMVGMESLAPSPIKIQYRYEKQNAS